MREAMDLITKKAPCVTFQPATPGSVNFVEIVSAPNCSSDLGMKGGERLVRFPNLYFGSRLGAQYPKNSKIFL